MRSILLALTLVIGTATMAQDADDNNDKRTPEERAKHRTEVMTKDLDLTPDQVTKVSDINLRFARENAEAKKLTDEKARKERSRGLKEKRDEELKAVLTADQYTKLMQQREDKKDDHKKDKDNAKKPHNE